MVALWVAALGPAIVLFVLILFWVVFPTLRNRKTGVGGAGIVQRSRLTCSKCLQTFDYEWVPGAALTAVRLGKDRYMGCPICHKWSLFNVWDAPAPPPKAPSPEMGRGGSAPPR